jgi:CRP-like cAMP-binding protein
VGSVLYLPDLKENQLLAALPDGELRRLAPRLQDVALQPGQVLYESGSTISHAYFPTTTLVTTLYEFDDGTSAETAITGKEGMVGIAIFMGGDSRLGRAVVLTAGHAFRLGAQALKDEFARTGALMHLLLHYTQALIT